MIFADAGHQRGDFLIGGLSVAIAVDPPERLFGQRAQLFGRQPAIAIGVEDEKGVQPSVESLIWSGGGRFLQGDDPVAVGVVSQEMMVDSPVSRRLIIGFVAGARSDFRARDPEIAVEVHRKHLMDRPRTCLSRATTGDEVDIALVEAVVGSVGLAKAADHFRHILLDMDVTMKPIGESVGDVGHLGLRNRGGAQSQADRETCGSGGAQFSNGHQTPPLVEPLPA
ncbi:hypothetical protein ACIPPQ_09745 [Sphingopyxis sp. LARHCG72]